MAEYDPELHLRQAIAGLLDKPSVYMGGPSRQNLRRADDIIAMLRGEPKLIDQLRAAEQQEERPSALADEFAKRADDPISKAVLRLGTPETKGR